MLYVSCAHACVFAAAGATSGWIDSADLEGPDNAALGYSSQGDALTHDSEVDMRDEVDDGWEMVAAPGWEVGFFLWSQSNAGTWYSKERLQF